MSNGWHICSYPIEESLGVGKVHDGSTVIFTNHKRGTDFNIAINLIQLTP